MARLIKSSWKTSTFVKLSTVYATHQTDRDFTIGDIVEGLRFVDNGEIKIVNGRIKSIGYSLKSPISFNTEDPKNTILDDVKLTSMNIDTSEQYHASSVVVPLVEVVEFDGEEDEEPVVRMKYSPYFVVDMDLYYSNYAVDHPSIEIGDTFTGVRIFNPDDIGNDITGKFKVIAFSYVAKSGVLDITGLVMENAGTKEVIIVPFKQIITLNEVNTYEITEPDAITEVISNLSNGDTISVTTELVTTGKPITVNNLKDIDIELQTDIVANGDATSGIKVNNSNVTFTGDGVVVNNTPYDSTHSKGVIAVNGTGEVTFNGSGVDAVIADDPVNKGQFGVTYFDQAKVTVNDGNFRTGWYCFAGNGNTTSADAELTINGGNLVSVADYAIYQPHAGKLIINDGYIAGAAGAIAANAGTIVINGGTLVASGGGDTGSSSDGTGGMKNAAINLNARYNDVTCIITGGKFIANADDVIMIDVGTAHTVTIKITGGLFSSKPKDEWIAEGYLSTNEPDEDGFYKVYKALL